MEIEDKRKLILNYLQKKVDTDCLKKIVTLRSYRIKDRLLKLLNCPQFYLPALIINILNRIIPKFILRNKSLHTHIFNMKEIQLPLDDLSSLLLIHFGCPPSLPDIKLTKFLVKNLQSEDIFYDIGANIGYYSYLASIFCKEVHIFEPLPFIFEYIKENLANDSNCFLNNLALSDNEGYTNIYVGKYGTGASTIVNNVYDSCKAIFRKEPIKIKTITLDRYLENHHPPTIIKLDVEGAESIVLKGAKNFLESSESSLLIIMEVWSDKENLSYKAVEILENLGFKFVYKINLDGELEQVDKKIIYLKEYNDLNYVFTKTPRL
ncbi:MAG: hypothetical protein KatS3mg094_234 [Candidatus Parcubacteria bacterium]|nr:MAG: hypothetical protein KatS3mg094_234 [Candidatus Parcubacteria bacterium]